MVVSPSPPSPAPSSEDSSSRRSASTDFSLFSVGDGRRRGSLPRYIDVRIRDGKRDRWTSAVPPFWDPSKETKPHPPHAIRSELKRVLLSDNVTEQKFLMAKLERIEVEKRKSQEQFADKKIKFINDLAKRKNPYIQTIKFGFEERLDIIPRLKSKDKFASHSAPIVRDAAAFLTQHRLSEAASVKTTPRLPFLQAHLASASIKRRPTASQSGQQQRLPALNPSRDNTYHLHPSPNSAVGNKERKTLSKQCIKDERFVKLEKILVDSDKKKVEPVWRRSFDSNLGNNEPVRKWELHNRRRRNSLR